ncbi:MAG: AbrB/MazE/SpoVT family DNA-binding domain-containing protein [Nanoarchaeota archaeon]
MITEEVVKIGKRGQITIPNTIRRKEKLREGDFLELSNIGGIITLRRVEKKPTVVDLFREVGNALRKQGVTTREKALALADVVKHEVRS